MIELAGQPVSLAPQPAGTSVADGLVGTVAVASEYAGGFAVVIGLLQVSSCGWEISA